MSLLPIACLLAFAGQVFTAAIPENQVEVYFVADHALLQRYMDEVGAIDKAKKILELDADYFINQINKLFTKIEGFSIGIMKRGLEILDEDILTGPDVERDEGLKTFDAWRKAQGTYDAMKYDIAVLWTGFELVRGGNPATAGYANVGKVCDPASSSLIAEFDMTYNTVLVTAHEIGHVLGSGHDSDKLRRVMGAEAYPGSSNRWSFSSQSVEHIKNAIAELTTNCLLETSPESESVHGSLPEDLIDPDLICMRSLNNKDSYMIKSQLYYDMQPPHGDTICRAIFCYDGEPDSSLAAYASDGMICGKNKRCKEGVCVESPDAESGSVTDECVFSDQKHVDIASFQGSCEQLIKDFGTRVCYYYKSSCCKTCARYASEDADCEFGDKSPKCEGKDPGSVCPKSSATCCKVCQGYKSKRSDGLNNTEVIPPNAAPPSYVNKTEVVIPMDD